MVPTEPVLAYLTGLHARLVRSATDLDGAGRFRDDAWERPGGTGVTSVLEGGALLERAGVAFSHVRGPALPPSATVRRPELAGRAFEAMGVSLVFHPLNPHVPTTHLNVRFLRTDGPDPAWWFGGGFDLTPYYPRLADVVAWHRAARAACTPFGDDVYPRLKDACDAYFHLPHRGETRGVGGLFFDDWTAGGFDTAFALARSVADAFWPAWSRIALARRDCPWDDAQRAFQLHRRGRYVEFNLLRDRGTLFGLQSGGRTESILMSMPPLAAWSYDRHDPPGGAEAALAEFLRPRDWLAGDAA